MNIKAGSVAYTIKALNSVNFLLYFQSIISIVFNTLAKVVFLTLFAMYDS